MIQQSKLVGNKMAVLNAYLSDINGRIDEETGLSKVDTRYGFLLCLYVIAFICLLFCNYMCVNFLWTMTYCY